MKNTIKKHAARVLAIVMLMSMLMSTMSIGSSALLGSVLSSSTITDGVAYASYQATNAKVYTMEFNPTETNLMPLAYTHWAGTSDQLADQIADAEANGYTVHGAINGEFFSTASGNHGTLTGRMLSNGRVITDHYDSASQNDEYSFVIDNEGNWQFVQSRLAYHLYINGTNVMDIERINKKFNGTWYYDCICYFDSSCGTKTDTNSDYPGVEVVFNKVNGTELMPEAVLEGEVVSVGTNTYGSAVGENQFVLYAGTGTAYHDMLAGLAVGEKVQIYVEELYEESKEIMKNANSTMAATYPVVVDGVNVAESMGPTNDIGQLSFSERAQRTAIGVKEDGTYVYFVSSGRNYNSGDGAGLTIAEVGTAMIELGCKYAVNLDGGGSSTMIAGSDTKYVTENRAVGSVMLIVSRNEATTSSEKKQMVNDWIYNANNTTYATTEQKALVDAAVANAEAVYNDAKSMNGEYTRAYMDIMQAMGVTTSVAPKTYISLDANDWFTTDSTLTISNNAAGALQLNSSVDWPCASYSCNVIVDADDTFYYEIYGSYATSVIIDTVEHGSLKLNNLLTPDNIDAGSGDSMLNGTTIKGAIPVSQIAEGGFTLTKITIYSIKWQGASSVTVSRFDFSSAGILGDVNGDSAVNSADARAILRYLAGKKTFDADQLAAADFNEDGSVSTDDVRAILMARVGLA